MLQVKNVLLKVTINYQHIMSKTHVYKNVIVINLASSCNDFVLPEPTKEGDLKEHLICATTK